jgi:hypothetical protein
MGFDYMRGNIIYSMMLFLLFSLLCGCKNPAKEERSLGIFDINYHYIMHPGEKKEMKLLYSSENITETKDFSKIQFINAEGENLSSINIEFHIFIDLIGYVTLLNDLNETTKINRLNFGIEGSDAIYYLDVNILIEDDVNYTGYDAPFPNSFTYDRNNQDAGLYCRDGQTVEFYSFFYPEPLGLSKGDGKCDQDQSYEITDITYPENDYLYLNVKYAPIVQNLYTLYDYNDFIPFNGDNPISINYEHNNLGFILFFEIKEKNPELRGSSKVMGFDLKYSIKYNGDIYTVYQEFKIIYSISGTFSS